MNEIKNVSGQIYGFVEEINENFNKMRAKNPNLTYDKYLEIAKIAVQDRRNDVLRERLRELNENLEKLNNNLEELGENLCNN